MTNVVVTSSPYLWADEAAPLQQRYYRMSGKAEAPTLESARLMTRLKIQGTVGATNWIQGTDLLVPHLWQVLTNVVVTSSPYVWVDEAATLGRQYQVSAKQDVPVEKVDPRRWAWIPPGMFTMGSPESERGRRSTEGPQTKVTLTKGFWLGKYEVTQREFRALMGSNPSYFQPANGYPEDLDRPVETVSWYDATDYCGKLTAGERAAGRLPAGYAYRLPTAAEWEYGCRAGTTTRYSFGDALDCDDGCGWCALLDSHMWWCGNSNKTRRVGGKLPNPWGLYDLHGNVWEWCGDWWSGNLSGGSVIDPTGAATGQARVLRGGSWYDTGGVCRSACRHDWRPASRDRSIGFRVVLAPGQ